MLITNNFVLLNLPKTGSTFCRAVIKNILDLYSGLIGFVQTVYEKKSKHGKFGLTKTQNTDAYSEYQPSRYCDGKLRKN